MGRTYEGTNKIEPILNPHFLIYVTEVVFYRLLHDLKLLFTLNMDMNGRIQDLRQIIICRFLRLKIGYTGKDFILSWTK